MLLRSRTEAKGFARNALKLLTRLSDETGIAIATIPRSFDEQEMSDEQLAAMSEAHGFVVAPTEEQPRHVRWSAVTRSLASDE